MKFTEMKDSIKFLSRFDAVRKADGWCPDILIKMKAIQ
jgi:hypothetical protein